MSQKITSYTILQALKKRHTEDVFVPECKDGSTQSRANHLKMDAWVMARSWTHPCVTGYEIKVSRSDFLADNKWHLYLPLCNVLNFACPPGVIKEDELPADVGLLHYIGSGDGARLVTKRKAVYRKVVIPERVFRYILICRSRIDNEGGGNTVDRCREFLEEQDEHKALGKAVKIKTSEMMKRLRDENEKMRKAVNSYADVRLMCEEAGIPVDYHSWIGLRQRLIARLPVEDLPKSIAQTLREVERQSQSLATRLEDQIRKAQEVNQNTPQP